MRQFISLLLIVSLSWVTTGYACKMDGNSVRAACHCPHEQALLAKAETDGNGAHENADGAVEKPRCCDVVISTALDDQQPGLFAASPAFDLPAFVLESNATLAWAEPTALRLASPAPARGPPGAGTRTYLSTARLRL